MNLEWVMRVELKSESLDKKIQYLLCQDEATLIYMVNLGCIDFNPWNSTVKKIDYPDYLIIDLDPEAVSFQDVVKVALKVREYLEKLDIESFVKTSGGRGMHILIPMGQKYTHEQVRIFAELLCSHIQVEMPELMSIRRSPKDRQKKVYLDYLQNGRGKTLASVYSVRPKPGAFVSTPLEWSEVNSKLDPSNFTMKNILKRVEKKGDLFKGVFGKGIDIKKVLKKLERY
jgi:bifunctional non-homologous end joining protein LigD